VSASLSVSVVSFSPDLKALRETLHTLAASLAHAHDAGSLGRAHVVLVDNGPGEHYAAALRPLVQCELGAPIESQVLSGHGNVGYGRANNMVMLASSANFHLVINPDVELSTDAIHEALRFMNANPDVVILAPEARDASGELLYLCKRYPSVLVLALRGFAPNFMKGILKKHLERYEMRDLPRNRPTKGIPFLSGSFMFCRRAPVAKLDGFSEDFFLYFEDFDFCMRAAARGALAWVPAVRITHHGGYAARKGWWHVWLFTLSAVKFFNRHGWKWV
jgi:GT2 family glycosyltransferase